MITQKYSIVLAQICAIPPQIGKTDIIEIGRSLRRLGQAVTIICGQEKNQPKTEMLLGLQIRRLPLPTRETVFTSFRYAHLIADTVRELSRTGRLDIVHILNPFLASFDCLYFLKRQAPTVRTVFDIRTGSLRSGTRKWLAEWSMRQSRRLADQTCVIDGSLAKTILRTDDKVTIVPLGVNADMFARNETHRVARRKQLALADSDIVSVYCGNLDERRQLARMITGFMRAAEKNPALKLVIVGDGNDRAQLERLAGGLLNTSILFLGKAPYTDIPSYLSAADLALSYVPKTAFFEHQPPLKVPEYLAASLPVLATNTAGNATFVRNGYNGLIVHDDSASIASGLKNMCDKFPAYTKNARPSIERFTWDWIVTNDLLPMYRRLLD